MGLKEDKEFVEDMISEAFAREEKRTHFIENLLKEEPKTKHFVGADNLLVKEKKCGNCIHLKVCTDWWKYEYGGEDDSETDFIEQWGSKSDSCEFFG